MLTVNLLDWTDKISLADPVGRFSHNVRTYVIKTDLRKAEKPNWQYDCLQTLKEIGREKVEVMASRSACWSVSACGSRFLIFLQHENHHLEVLVACFVGS